MPRSTVIDAARDNIFLIGLMGAGKTTVGRMLARRLDKEFIDADRELEQRTGASVSLIFEIEGEAGFRERETRLLDEITSRRGIVLATGGGAILSEENRQRLRARGYVIYLRAPLDQLIDRTRKDRRRPLLQTEDRAATLAELYAARDPLYGDTADLIVETDHRTVRHLVNRICRLLRAQCEP